MSTLPTIPRWRSFRNSFQMVTDPIPVINQTMQQYGNTYQVYLGGATKGLVTREPGIIQHVLQKNHRNYEKSFIQTDVFARYVGHGLLTSNGDYWLRQRRLIQPGFHRDKLTALTGTMNQVIEELLLRLDEAADSGVVLELEQVMMELAFQIVAKSLFTTDVDEEVMERLGRNITALQNFIVRQIRQPYLNPWFRWSGRVKKHEKLADESKAIILKIIKNRQGSGKRYDDLLDMLLAARYQDTGEPMEEQQLLEESLILFVAGHETSANALAWTCYLLSQHPEVVAKMRTELESVLNGRIPDFGDLSQLVYLTQVIQESMRLYPPAWITDRIALAEDEVNGIAISKGMMMVLYIYGAHHNEVYWPEPQQFRPQRFEKELVKNRHPFSYLPFGGGPRLCIGNSFAMMEMQLVLARLVQRYDFDLVPGQRIATLPLITLRPKYGIKMRLRMREGRQPFGTL